MGEGEFTNGNSHNGFVCVEFKRDLRPSKVRWNCIGVSDRLISVEVRSLVLSGELTGILSTYPVLALDMFSVVIHPEESHERLDSRFGLLDAAGRVKQKVSDLSEVEG